MNEHFLVDLYFVQLCKWFFTDLIFNTLSGLSIGERRSTSERGILETCIPSTQVLLLVFNVHRVREVGEKNVSNWMVSCVRKTPLRGKLQTTCRKVGSYAAKIFNSYFNFPSPES